MGLVNVVYLVIRVNVATWPRGGVNTGVCAGRSVGDEPAVGREFVAPAPEPPTPPSPTTSAFLQAPNCFGIKMGKA